MTESTYRWIEVERFAQPFAARIGGVDITAMLDDAVFDEIRLALDEFGVLVFSNQRFNDDSQVAFSQRFGALERTISANPAGGSAFARQSNVDINSGELIGTGDGRMRYQAANMSWHADSTFKAHRSLCSVLSARVVPPQGGATQFATTRTAYEALDATRRCELESLEVVHDIVAGRRRLGSARRPLSQRLPLGPLPGHPFVAERRDADRRATSRCSDPAFRRRSCTRWPVA